MPPGRSSPDRRHEELALELGQLRYVRGRLAPPRFGATAKGAEAGARRVDQDPVVGRRRRARVAAVLFRDRHLERDASDRLADEAGASRRDLVRLEAGSVEQGFGSEHRRLAAGAGARSSQRSSDSDGEGAA